MRGVRIMMIHKYTVDIKEGHKGYKQILVLKGNEHIKDIC